MAFHLIMPEDTSPEDEALFRHYASWLECLIGTDTRLPVLTTAEEPEEDTNPPPDCT